MINLEFGLTEYGCRVMKISFTNKPVIEIDITNVYNEKIDVVALYKPILNYYHTLPLGIQNTIYDMFYSANVVDIDLDYQSPSYVISLEDRITFVCSILNFTNFKTYIHSTVNDLKLPDTLIEEFIYDQDMNNTAEKTYIKSSYIDFLALIMFMRCVFPIAIPYYIYQGSTNSSHRSYRMFMLFVSSEVYTSPEILKLKSYMHANEKTLQVNKRIENTSIMGGLSDDELYDSLIGFVVFTKLLNIDFYTKPVNVISIVFNTFRYRQQFNTATTVTTRSKGGSKTTGGDATDMSYHEDFRITTKISPGGVVEIQHSLSNLDNIAMQLGIGEFDKSSYLKELRFAPSFRTRRLNWVQHVLLGWFLSSAVNPRALQYIDHTRLIDLIFFAKTMLVNCGHGFIGVLLCSYKVDDSSYITPGIVKNTLKKEDIDKLSNKYINVLEADADNIKKGPTVIESTIMNVTREIAGCIWSPMGAKEHLKEYVNEDGCLIIPPNINEIICDYIGLVIKNH